MLLIGDLARRCGLSASALRFYDGCGLLAPFDVAPASGYRRYHEDQAVTAELIRDLRGAGMALAQVKEFLTSSSSRRRELLDQHREVIAANTGATHRFIRQLRAQLNPTEFPMTQTMDVDAAQLRHGLQHMLTVASRDQERPLLQTVLLEGAEGSLRLVATDRHRLAVRDLVTVDGSTSEFTALVAVASAQRAIDALAGTGPVTLSSDEQYLRMSQGEQHLNLPKVAAQFVDYASLLHADVTSHVLVASSVEVTRALAPMRDHESVVLTFAPDQLNVDGEAIPAAYRGAGISLHVNPAYLLDALGAAAGPDIALEASTELRPITIRSADNGTCVHLLMPIKPD